MSLRSIDKTFPTDVFCERHDIHPNDIYGNDIQINDTQPKVKKTQFDKHYAGCHNGYVSYSLVGTRNWRLIVSIKFECL